MSKILSSLLRVCFCALGFSLTNSSIALAQITPDNTVNTQVTQNSNVAEITGGETRGANLFHSFQDFSVPTDNIADFQNADSISNIFSRVTGGNVSNIDGMIRANGSANLFLINPAGIMFGENANLNIGGSFYVSSASSILFENGEFSTDLANPPLLTVNAPIGLGFRDNPGDITANQADLEVPTGETLALLGGNLNVDGGIYGTLDGRLELGGLTESGTININNDGSFSFPQAVSRGNLFAAAATFAVGGEEGGAVAINAKNLSLTSGSFLLAAIFNNSEFANAQGGDVVINLTEDFVLDDSLITNSVLSGAGNTGNIKIDARNITFNNGGTIASVNVGEGDPGSITLTATKDITFNGIGSNGFSGINNSLGEGGGGNIGEINLTAQNFNLTNGANIISLSQTNNDSGDINLNVADTIRIDGSGVATAEDGTQSEFVSTISSGVSNTLNNTNGNGGNINIDSQNLILNGGVIGSLNTGQGNAGDININVDSLSIAEVGFITSGIIGSGNGGNIVINAKNSLSIIGNSESSSIIASNIGSSGTGKAGDIEINTASLILNQGGLSAGVSGQGNGGEINVSASESIQLSNRSVIAAAVARDATGNAGNLTIETKQLVLNDRSQISASTNGNGNAGNITINASESVSLSSTNGDGSSRILADALIEDGDGGNINLTTDQLTISDGATITASNFASLGTFEPGTGEPGNINITANNLSLETGGRIQAITQAETGNGANIDLEIADGIFLSGDGFISARALGNANGGNLTIDTNFIVAFAGNNDIIASAEQGQGGNIDITAESLLGIKASTLSPFTNDINASSEFGLDGSVSVDVPDIASLQGGTELATGIVTPEETSTQACQANRVIAAQNGFVIKGKGGVPAAPELPLNTGNIIIDGEIKDPIADSKLPQPLETSRGQIQPARGIKLTDKGGIILTAYRTNNQGDRLPNAQTSCG